MEQYDEIMRRFTWESLNRFAGENVTSLLAEWIPTSNAVYDKLNLIRVIEVSKLYELRNNPEFYNELLAHLNTEDLNELASKFGIKSSMPVIEIVHKISEKLKRKKNKDCFYKAIGLPVDTDNKCNENFETKLVNTDQFYELFDYQYMIKQRALDIVTNNEVLQRALIQMPTGTGKTKTAMHLIVQFICFYTKKKGLVIWLAHTNVLLEQAFETFQNVWKHLGSGEIEVYPLFGDYKMPESFSRHHKNNGIVFCSIEKLISIYKKDINLFDNLVFNCRLLVFDEAHKATAKQTKNVIEQFMKKTPDMEDRSLLGLTATPGRTTDISVENAELAAFFRENLVSIDVNLLNQMNLGTIAALNEEAENNIIRYFQNRGILAKMREERLEYQSDLSFAEIEEIQQVFKLTRGEDYSSKQLKILIENRARNMAILKRLEQLNFDKVPTIVFAASVDHAKMLSAMLNCKTIPNRLVIGEMNQENRRKAIKDFKDRNNDINIIINYGVLTTGFDSKNIKCVFITRPTKSVILYSQMLGRGLRGPLMGGNEECLLIDIKDNLDEFNNEEAFHHFSDYWN